MRQRDPRGELSLVSMMKLMTLTSCCLVIAAVNLSAQSSETTTKTPGNDGRALDPTITAPASTPPATNMAPRVSPQQHLADARRDLTGISEKSVPADAQKNFSQLLKDFSALASSAEAQPETAGWRSTFYDVERDLVRLVGGGGPPAPGGEPEANPRPKAEVPDAGTRAILQAFRTHIELFYDAATTRVPGTVTLPPLARGSSF
jgi:hypothetical protein